VAHSATLRSIENAIGGDGADTIIGTLGANRLAGGAGNDSINAAGGNDTIIGGAGSDTLLGAGGIDVFTYLAITDSTPDAPDLLGDFSRPLEVIDLSAIDADPLTAGDQGFAFLGSGAFTGAGAQLRVFADIPAGITRVEVRLAGSTANDMLITLTGFGVFTEANFLL
jgi:serralysin